MRPDMNRPDGSVDLDQPFEVAGRRIYPQRNEVVVAGERRRLESRHMKVLLSLAGAAGETAPRECLLDAGWGGQAVGDDSLTQAISRLRRALGDQSGEDRLIETVPKVGYRLVHFPKPLSGGQNVIPVKPTAILSRAAAIRSWAGANARAFLFSGIAIVFAAAFGWRASELMLSPAQGADAADSAQAAPSAAPERRIILKTFVTGSEPESPETIFRGTDL